MAKIPYGKLNLNKNTSVNILKWGDVAIEVKQYLPVLEKMNLVNKILQDAADEKNYYHPARLDVFFAINVFFAYAGVSITEKQREDAGKLYDSLISSGLYQQVLYQIPGEEIDWIYDKMRQLVEKLDDYANSVYGILDYMGTNYGDLKNDAQKLLNDLSENKGVELIGDIVSKMN